MKKTNLLKLILTPIALFSIIACSKGKTNSSSFDDEEDRVPTEHGANPVIKDSKEYKEFWDNKSEIKLKIVLAEEAADFINNYQYNHDDSTYFDYYVPCDVEIVVNGVKRTFEEVGIRQKGNMSRRHLLTDGKLSLDSLVHFKLNFKETFDDEEYDTIPELKKFKSTWDDDADRKARKARRLFDMEKIDIKWNRNDDQSKSKQAYAYKTFRDNDVMAPHSTLGETTLQIDAGTPITTTYEIIEVIDEVFIQRNFEKELASGDLYKCTYTNKGPANFSKSYKVGDQIGVEDNAKGYHPAYDLKTNKKKNTEHLGLLNLIKVMNDKTSDAETYKKNIEKVLDIKSFIKYESIAYLCGNFDDLRNNANNYYLYIASTTNMAYIIPYDFDRCFGMGAEGRKNYMTDFSPESTKMQANEDWQKSTIYWRTICSSTDSKSGFSSTKRVEEYRALYQKNIEDLLNNKIVSYDSFKTYANEYPSSYRGNPDGSGKDNTSFNNYLSLKIAAIKKSNSDGLINYDIK